MIRRRSQCCFNVLLPFKMTKINKLLGRGGGLIRGSGDPITNGISIAGETSNKILKKIPLNIFETILYFGPFPLDARSRA